ncbi:hypothetical protein LEP1GSC124_0761, partial [Leptospira interrogans serovar Pyrogenes str. 200701872]
SESLFSLSLFLFLEKCTFSVFLVLLTFFMSGSYMKV